MEPPSHATMREVRKASDHVLELLVKEARRMIENVICGHARSEKAYPRKLEWLSGIWIAGERGEVLTSDGKPVLWVSVAPRKSKALGSDKIALFSFTSIDLSNLIEDAAVGEIEKHVAETYPGGRVREIYQEPSTGDGVCDVADKCLS